jgi:hypothetical protein
MTKDEALDLALRALRFARDDGYENEISQQAITAIKQALAAPVQEPVAIVSGYYGGQCVVLPIDPARIFNSGTAFYISPPAQEFVCSTGLCHYKVKSDERLMEPWNPNDTANRIGGLPQDFIKHEVENEGDWSEWVNPNPEQYFMKCCDCGLVHEMQFKVAKYSEGDECEFVDDPDLQPVFRAKRADVARQEKNAP